MKIKLHMLSWLGIWGALILGTLPLFAADYFVWRDNPNPEPPYTSWSTAATTIQEAVDQTAVGDTVYVTNGVYDTGGALYNGLTNRVVITKAITVRSIETNPALTIIKGRFHSGEPGVAGTITNGLSAIRCVYLANQASLIGFTLTNGATDVNASGKNASLVNGGGVYCGGVSASVSNCVIAGNAAGNNGGGTYYGSLFNCTVTDNTAELFGGGVNNGYLVGCTLTGNRGGTGGGATYCTFISNCTFVGNMATDHGGGIAGSSAMRSDVSDCIVASNTAAKSGGGVYYINMTDSTIVGNIALNDRGGGANGANLLRCRLIGNIVVNGNGGGAVGGNLTNCIVSGNSALGDIKHGGGVYASNVYGCLLIGNSADYAGGAHSSTLYNCTVVGNSATTYLGSVRTSTLYNTIIYLNSPDKYSGDTVFSNCCLSSAPSGLAAGNISDDPLFVANGTGYGLDHVAGDYHLRPNSPCVNSGLNQGWMEGAVDLDGRKRIFYDVVDMGAYEAVYPGTAIFVR